MFQSIAIPFNEAGTINNLVSDYLTQSNSLRAFYNEFPSLEAFKHAAGSSLYEKLDRKKLQEILKQQAIRVSNTSEHTFSNIALLEHRNSYTVTTGHQLCLFTGPLYFIYKLFSVINICEYLKKEIPSGNFIPVYWLASEDHDFEEVNHFHAFGKKMTWNSSQQGAVGNFETGGLETVLEELKTILGETDSAKELLQLFESSYLKHNNLADATRFLVNEMFGKYGLVVVDGNDRHFKQQFTEEFKTDIFQNIPFTKVSESAGELKNLGYTIQVNPREINCFYLEKNKRVRIEKQGENFNLVNDESTFTKEQLSSLIDQTPEKISPNVVLRPLYQQTILPNLAYVGGPGELAYWLEFKKMFDEAGTHFPLLIIRSSLTIADANTFNRINKLNLDAVDFFKSEQEIGKKFLSEKKQVFETANESEQIVDVYKKLEERLLEVDKTLVATVKAELQKTLNSLQAIEGKANRALKQQSETELKQITTVKEKFFPGGTLQERHDNFSMYYVRYGKTFLEELKKQVKPFEYSHLVVYA